MTKTILFKIGILIIGNYLLFGAWDLVLFRNDHYSGYKLNHTLTLPNVTQDLSPHIRLSGRFIRQDSL
jgi:hypothetical protein